MNPIANIEITAVKISITGVPITLGISHQCLIFFFRILLHTAAIPATIRQKNSTICTTMIPSV